MTTAYYGDRLAAMVRLVEVDSFSLFCEIVPR